MYNTAMLAIQWVSTVIQKKLIGLNDDSIDILFKLVRSYAKKRKKKYSRDLCVLTGWVTMFHPVHYKIAYAKYNTNLQEDKHEHRAEKRTVNQSDAMGIAISHCLR